jgi:hypothetical protein
MHSAVGISAGHGGEDVNENESLQASSVVSYVVKAAMPETDAKVFSFPAQKTMYGGKNIAAEDEIFLFASENEGGRGLIALGVVTAAARAPTVRGAGGRGTPRVSITVRRIASAKRSLGRNELKSFRDWGDGRPQTELCFKLYRQATNKVVGITQETAAFLRTLF